MEKWWRIIEQYYIEDVQVKVYEWPSDRIVAVTKDLKSNAFYIERNNVATNIAEGNHVFIPTFDLDDVEGTLGDQIKSCLSGGPEIKYMGVFIIDKPKYVGIVGMDSEFEPVVDFHTFRPRRIEK